MLVETLNAGLGSTLSSRLALAQVRVLPKQHTPASGLTLRSLTHHLALHVGSEVVPRWYTVPQRAEAHGLNLLVAPWPLVLHPSQFKQVPGALANLPGRFGMVEFSPVASGRRLRTWIAHLIDAATRVSGHVDGVVFPEASMSADDFDRVARVVEKRGAFLIAGVVRKSATSTDPPANQIIFHSASAGFPTRVVQAKHHRWRIDRSQIETYGLGGTLDPGRDWWENIAIDQREVHFVTLNPQLTMCYLICEDLARQDPVAQLVRSVGPNLVISILMDAPQLETRWPARYATVLADDPGSSVLTVSSAGMVDLARPPAGVRPSRSVGLWKDARSRAVELELPPGADGLLLNLWTESSEEWTADGRPDGGVSGGARLAGVHPVRIPQTAARQRS